MSNIKGFIVLCMIMYSIIFGVYILSEYYQGIFTGQNTIILLGIVISSLGALVILDDNE